MSAARTGPVAPFPAWGAVSGLLGLALVPPLALYLATQYESGDTAVLIKHVHEVLGFVAEGRWSGWGGAFPLLQNLVAAPLAMAGLSDDGIVRGLVAANLLALFGLCVIGWTSLRRRSALVAGAFVAAMLAGPLLWYGHSSFGEMLAALVTVALLAAIADRARGAWVALLLAAGAISKDTALPFLLLLALPVALVASDPAAGWTRRLRLAPLAAGSLLGLALVAGFNFVQYGSISNTHYLTSTYYVPTLAIQARFFAAIWLSPNGGVIPFWPAWTALMGLGLAAVAMDAAAARGRARLRALLPALAVGAVLLGLTLGFSRWVAPLGWISWGARFMMPWLPATLFVVAVAHAPRLERLLAGLFARRWLAALVLLGLAGASLPQYVTLFRSTLQDPLFAPDAVCPRIPFIEKESTYYYRCTIHQLWSKHSILLDAYHPHFDRLAFYLGAVCCAGWAWFAGLPAWRGVAFDRQ